MSRCEFVAVCWDLRSSAPLDGLPKEDMGKSEDVIIYDQDFTDFLRGEHKRSVLKDAAAIFTPPTEGGASDDRPYRYANGDLVEPELVVASK